jgi:hypothetical protein
MALSQARLKQLLHYNPKTGHFTWRVNRPGRFARIGIRAGTITRAGYRQICIDQKLYRAGPIAVFYMTGSWPRRMADHHNGKSADDRWLNLRNANNSQNTANSRAQKKKLYSSLKGVTRHRTSRRSATVAVAGELSALW